MIVGARKRLEHVRPLRRALAVACELAGEEEGAADICERLERSRLAARRSRHRLVEMCEPFVEPSGRYLSQAELCERLQLQIAVARRHRDREGGLRMPRGGHGIPRSRGACEVEPPVVGARGDGREQPLGPRKPATCRGGVPPDQRILAREPKGDPRCPGQVPVATETCVGALAVDDGAPRIA